MVGCNVNDEDETTAPQYFSITYVYIHINFISIHHSQESQDSFAFKDQKHYCER